MEVNEEEQPGAVEAGERLGLQAERSLATRTVLLQTARALFAERGYAAVGTEEIVRAAGVTRGALYHHFEGKLELFAAVYEQVETELLQGIALAVDTADAAPLQVLHAGARAFLDASENDAAVQRIALIDAPSVLGWERWREIGMRYGLGLVRGTIEAAIEAGEVEPQPAEPLAHLLLGAIDEGALLVARSDDGGETRRQVSASLDRVLSALTAPAGG